MAYETEILLTGILVGALVGGIVLGVVGWFVGVSHGARDCHDDLYGSSGKRL